MHKVDGHVQHPHGHIACPANRTHSVYAPTDRATAWPARLCNVNVRINSPDMVQIRSEP